MKLIKIITLTSAIVATMCLTSCRKELCYNHFRTASLNLSYEREWERDYGMSHQTNWDAQLHGHDYDHLRPDVPEWINLITYAPGKAPLEAFLEVEGGEVNVEGADDQSFLLYNGDTEYVVVSDVGSHATARASSTSRSRSTLAAMMSKYPNVRSTNPPDMLYAAYVDKVPRVEMHEVKPIPVTMKPLVYTYKIRYEFEHGLEHVGIARGAIGGMAESVYLRSGATADEESVILYDCELTSWGCVAHVQSFGIPGFPDKYYSPQTRDNQRLYTLNLEVRLSNGKILDYDFDIADQIEKQPRGGVITVKGIRVEDEENKPVSGSMFDVDVEGWGEHEDIDLPVGVKK